MPINNIEEVKSKFCRPTDERALLAYCLKDIESYYSLLSQMSRQDFLHPDHNSLFAVLSSLHGKGVEHFDIPLIIREAQENGVLTNIGGIEYLQSIRDMRVDKSNFDVYLKNVLESNIKYELYTILQENLGTIEKNTKDGKTGDELIGAIENSILDLSTESRAIKEPVNMKEGLRELIEDRRKNKVDLMGLSTGFSILDSQIDGLVPGTLTVVSARPKKGKSAFLSNIAAYIAFQESIPVLYIDTEMPFEQWRDRIIASMASISERDVKHGGYDNETYNKIVSKCINIVEKGKLFHEFMPGYSVDKLTALYKKYKMKHDIGLMVFDYIKEPHSDSIERQRKEYQVLGDVTTRLKDLAGELNIPALTAVQINRDGDVADSDRIIRYADVVCQWMKKDLKEIENGGDNAGTHKLVIRETRRGGMTPEEGIGYFFHKTTLHIKEVPAPDQLIPSYGNKVINYGSADDEIK